MTLPQLEQTPPTDPPFDAIMTPYLRNSMTNFLIKYLFQFPVIWVMINALESSYDMSVWLSCLVASGLLILYDIGDYITRDDLK